MATLPDNGVTTLLITIPNLETAGSKFVVADIVKGLKSSGLHIIVCTSRPSTGDHIIKSTGTELIYSPFTADNPFFIIKIFKILKLAWFFKKLKIDYWHSWNYTSDFTEPLIAKLAGVNNWYYTKKSLAWSKGWKVKSLLADKIITNNPLMRDHFFLSPLFFKKVICIPQGVDTGKFQPVSISDNIFRAKFNLPDKAKIIGCVSDLLPNKNQLLIIDAMQKLTSLAHLVLIGRHDTQYGKKVKDEVDNRQLTSFVHFFGPSSQEELPVLINSIDIFCYASKSEGMPVSLLEAMACGKPCVSTRNLGTSAIIINGIDGILLDNNTFEDMVLGITKIIDNKILSDNLGNSARLKVVNSFNAESQAESYKRLYMEG